MKFHTLNPTGPVQFHYVSDNHPLGLQYFLHPAEPFCQACFGIQQFVHSVYILSQFLFIILFNPSSAYLLFVSVPSSLLLS
jgi:uncharacterized membrane protein